MRFLMLVKGAENCGPPPPGLIEVMGKCSTEAQQSGEMIENGGLAPSAMSSRVRLSNGAVAVHDGPFAESKEIIGGYAIMQFPSKAEAVAAATWLMNLHKEHWPGWEGEVEVRQMFGPEDFDAMMQNQVGVQASA